MRYDDAFLTRVAHVAVPFCSPEPFCRLANPLASAVCARVGFRFVRFRLFFSRTCSQRCQMRALRRVRVFGAAPVSRRGAVQSVRC
jgi:hypothetical protein